MYISHSTVDRHHAISRASSSDLYSRISLYSGDLPDRFFSDPSFSLEYSRDDRKCIVCICLGYLIESPTRLYALLIEREDRRKEDVTRSCHSEKLDFICARTLITCRLCYDGSDSLCFLYDTEIRYRCTGGIWGEYGCIAWGIIRIPWRIDRIRWRSVRIEWNDRRTSSIPHYSYYSRTCIITVEYSVVIEVIISDHFYYYLRHCSITCTICDDQSHCVYSYCGIGMCRS